MAEEAKPAPRKKGAKRRERREVRTGIAHIQATFNNTIVTLTDRMGNVVSWSSAGFAGAILILGGGIGRDAKPPPSASYPCRALCRGFLQMIRVTP